MPPYDGMRSCSLVSHILILVLHSGQLVYSKLAKGKFPDTPDDISQDIEAITSGAPVAATAAVAPVAASPATAVTAAPPVCASIVRIWAAMIEYLRVYRLLNKRHQPKHKMAAI